LGDRKKAGLLLEVAEKLTKVKESVAKGKKIDALKIDPPVSPVVILGLDDASRLESIVSLHLITINVEFNEIIQELTVRFEEHK
jgi:hypothetical protein